MFVLTGLNFFRKNVWAFSRDKEELSVITECPKRRVVYIDFDLIYQDGPNFNSLNIKREIEHEKEIRKLNKTAQ